MPKPMPDESQGDYMARCHAAGHNESDCQRYWEEVHPTAHHPLTIHLRGEVAEVLLYEQIGADPFFGGGVTAKQFRQEIKGLKARILNLRINSPGGSVIDGAAMLAALDEFSGRVEVDVDGVAASAASVVMMGGDHIRVAQNALVMVHNPMAGVLGGAQDMRKMADLLDKVKGQLLDSYSRHSKAGKEQLP